MSAAACRWRRRWQQQHRPYALPSAAAQAAGVAGAAAAGAACIPLPSSANRSSWRRLPKWASSKEHPWWCHGLVRARGAHGNTEGSRDAELERDADEHGFDRNVRMLALWACQLRRQLAISVRVRRCRLRPRSECQMRARRAASRGDFMWAMCTGRPPRCTRSFIVAILSRFGCVHTYSLCISKPRFSCDHPGVRVRLRFYQACTAHCGVNSEMS